MKKKLALFLVITSLLCCSCESESQTDGTTTTTPKISTTTTTTTSEAPTITTTTTDTEATVTTTTTTAQTSATADDTTTSEEENTTTPPDSTTTEPSDTTASSESTTTPEAQITTTTATTTVPQTSVTPSTTTTTAPNYTAITKTTMYATTSVNVRAGAGTSYDILGRLSANQSVTVIGTSGNWYAIEFNGKTGFVSKSYLSKNKVTATTTTTSKPITGGFTSSYAYGSDEYTWELLEYFGITDQQPSNTFTDEEITLDIEDGYEDVIADFISKANGREVILIKNPSYYSFYGWMKLAYRTPCEDYVWTDEDCFRLLADLQAYADSVGYDKLYIPTEMSYFDGTDSPYGGWVYYACTGIQHNGSHYARSSNTFEGNYNSILNLFKIFINDCNNPESSDYGKRVSLSVTPLKDFNQMMVLQGFQTENPAYENGRADSETSFVFIDHGQCYPSWYEGKFPD